jgi:hypothetical protein
VAEKLEAMVSLGPANSRMKDFYDVWLLASLLTFEGATLGEGIHATFERRGTPLPGPDLRAISREFLAAPETLVHWRAFWRRSRVDAGPASIDRLADRLREFLGPPLAALAQAGAFQATWRPGGPWRPAESGR